MKRHIILIALFCIALLAQGQTPASVLTVPQDRLIPGAACGLRYDRIETVRTIPGGQYTAFAVPATLDGYFFGADAERYEVQSIQALSPTGKQFNVKKMDDDADFVSGKFYIVCPELGADRLYSYTAGIQAPVGTSQVGLECYPIPLKDVTYDRLTNLSDVSAILDIIMDKDPQHIHNHQVADMNANGVINITDIVLMLNAILTHDYNIIVVE